ncbi:hypothetical protein BGZ61DRAFT_447972, partial [Ilyonectria robusta]|uniref:uncharacterized protein n=1 Tax=Ilyonectria robusta TaxID=1079257 RepID=UPI001E8DF4A4
MSTVVCLGDAEEGQPVNISSTSNTPTPTPGGHCVPGQDLASRWRMVAHHSPTWLKSAIEAKSESLCLRSSSPARKSQGSYVPHHVPDSGETVLSSLSIHRAGRPSCLIKAGSRRRRWARPANRRVCSETCQVPRKYARTIPSRTIGPNLEGPDKLEHAEYPGSEYWNLELGDPGQLDVTPQSPSEDLFLKTESSTPSGEEPPPVDQEAAKSVLSDIQQKLSCLAIADQAEPGCDVEASTLVEQIYSSGETLPVPDVELSDDSEVDDDTYWEWDKDKQKFRHWDDEDEEWVYFPDAF